MAVLKRCGTESCVVDKNIQKEYECVVFEDMTKNNLYSFCIGWAHLKPFFKGLLFIFVVTLPLTLFTSVHADI